MHTMSITKYKILQYLYSGGGGWRIGTGGVPEGSVAGVPEGSMAGVPEGLALRCVDVWYNFTVNILYSIIW